MARFSAHQGQGDSFSRDLLLRRFAGELKILEGRKRSLDGLHCHLVAINSQSLFLATCRPILAGQLNLDFPSSSLFLGRVLTGRNPVTAEDPSPDVFRLGIPADNLAHAVGTGEKSDLLLMLYKRAIEDPAKLALEYRNAGFALPCSNERL